MKIYFLVFLSVLFCSSCKKDKHYDRSDISISNKSNIGCDSVYVYVNIYNGYINDSLYSKKRIEHKCKTNCAEITHALINIQLKSFNHFLKPL